MERTISVAPFGVGCSLDVVRNLALEIKEIRATRPELEKQVQSMLDAVPSHCKLPSHRSPIRRYVP